MGRVRFRKTITTSDASEDLSENNNPIKCNINNHQMLKKNCISKVERKHNLTQKDLTENSHTSNSKRNNPQRLKENIAVKILSKNNEKPRTKKENCRSALSDKTNSTLNEINPEKRDSLTENHVSSSKYNNSPKTVNTKSSIFTEQSQNGKSKNCDIIDTEFNENKEKKHFVPIYKQNQNTVLQSAKKSLPVEDKLALYEFEVDDTEEPAKVKKKRKKRNYNQHKKYKVGTKSLTINNIKFSSSESINSLADACPLKRHCKAVMCMPKKQNLLKRQSQSMMTLNDTRDTCVSVASYKSQQFLQTSTAGTDNYHHNLSMIEENEMSVVPQQNISNHEDPTSGDEFHGFEENHNGSGVSLTGENFNLNSFIVVQNTSHLAVDHHDISDYNNISYTPLLARSDGFEENHNGNEVSQTVKSFNPHSFIVQNTSHSAADHHDVSDYNNISYRPLSEQISQTNLQDIYSSTPYKNKTSLLQQNYSDSSQQVRSMERESDLASGDEFNGFDEIHCDSDCYTFGFDEDEHPEEPLVSPIKNNSKKFESVENKPESTPKLSVQEIVQLLQSETKEEEPPSTIVEESIPSETEEEVVTLPDNVTRSFIKPPRRSYTRQSIRRNSFHEKEPESSEDEDFIVKEVKRHVIKRKPKMTKGKKEEQEAERMAQMINSKFQEVEQFNLCVE